MTKALFSKDYSELTNQLLDHSVPNDSLLIENNDKNNTYARKLTFVNEFDLAIMLYEGAFAENHAATSNHPSRVQPPLEMQTELNTGNFQVPE